METAAKLEFRLLGPLEVLRDGERLELGPAKQRAVLAMLLLRANEPVATDELIEALWPGKPPGRPQTAVQGYVHGLRKVLGPDTIETTAGGYLLHVESVRLDLHRFERLLEQGREALARDRAGDAASRLREALALWHGAALADFTYGPWAQNEIGRLEELRLVCTEARIDADLALGRDAELVPELERLVADQPLRERLRGGLMQALYRAGRQAEALDAYQSFRRLLGEELGIDPSPKLKELERRILQQDLDLATALTTGLPAGTVTLIATDIEGSTRLLQRLGDRYGDALAEHRRLLSEVVSARGGREVDSQGDSVLAVFPRANDAVRAAVEVQRRLAAVDWPNDEHVLVRMGVHTGEPTLTDGRYVGLDVHRVARICAAAHGGQIVLSRETRELVENLPDGVRLVDLGDHRLRDVDEPERLYQLEVEGLATEFPPLKTIHQTNLPTPPTSLIGRERELQEIRELLRTARVLTLTGAGGSGKTRLALQTAAEAMEEFPDGVWFVSLAAVTDARLVEPTIAQIVGSKNGLADHLRAQRALLLLDNFEHLLEAAHHISGLLAEAPNVQVLVTSRAPLRVVGEQEYPVPPLDDDEAAAFFVERARAVNPAFSDDEWVPEICRRLDGLPLALELAAAKVRVLPLSKLLERLELRLPLLTRGVRDAPARQQTMKATIEWSHDLLSSEEQELFRRVAVFAGGFTLEAAEHVADAELGTLESLVEKSLLWHEAERFTMLETIREFGVERLHESPDVRDVEERHGQWVAALFEQAEPELEGAAQDSWLDRLAMEHDNLRAALRSACARVDSNLALRLAGASATFWWIHGHWAEGRRWLEQALSQPTPHDPALRAKALEGAAHLAVRQLDNARANELAQEALALARDQGDASRTARVLRVLALIAVNEEDDKRFLGYVQESATFARRCDDLWALSMALSNLGYMALASGEVERAESLFAEGLSLARRRGDERTEAFVLENLALAKLEQGLVDQARDDFRASLRLARRLRFVELIATDMLGLAAAAAAGGDADGAARLLGAAQHLGEQIGIGGKLDWLEQQVQKRTRASIERSLGPERCAEAILLGRRLHPDEVLNLALDPIH